MAREHAMDHTEIGPVSAAIALIKRVMRYEVMETYRACKGSEGDHLQKVEVLQRI